MPFRPSPAETITIAGNTYSFTEHPAAPGMAYGQAGRRGTVYQLSDEHGQLWALKVFLRQYREPRLVGQAERLKSYAGLPGLQAAAREVLTGSRQLDLIREHPDLAYAVVMPWVSGRTWMEIILEGSPLPAEESLQLAGSLARVLVGLEEHGLAHCDLSGPNVIVLPDGSMELVDLEEMYGPELMKPEQLPGGSPGYAHKTAPGGLWNPRADRFAGAVLLAEMLGWSDERVVGAKWGEEYFAPDEMQASSERYRLLRSVLNGRWGEETAGLLDAAWHSAELGVCPTFTEWLAALPVEPLETMVEKASPAGAANPAERAEAAGEEPHPGDWDEGCFLEEGEKSDDAELEPVRWVGEGIPRAGEETPGSGFSVEEAEEDENWTCPVCGEQVRPVETLCPYCEKGERPEGVQAGGAAVAVPGMTDMELLEVEISPVVKPGLKTGAGGVFPWAWLGIALLVGGGLYGGGKLIADGQDRRALETAMQVSKSETEAAAVHAAQTETARPTATTTQTSTPAMTPTASLTPTTTLGVGSSRVRESDGMVEVYVPAGTFLMGSAEDDPAAGDDEFPQHEVYLEAYWIDQTEVTYAQYAKCVEEEECRGGWESSEYPVAVVNWFMASAYCEWAGGRLPTEAEWEKAARGTEGQKYPWGDAAPTCRLANFRGCSGGTTPAGSYPAGASLYGVLDMAGNVSEWVADGYDEDYYDRSPDANSMGPETSELRGVRGGSWFTYPRSGRSASRNWINAYRGLSPDVTGNYIGFRCVRSP